MDASTYVAIAVPVCSLVSAVIVAVLNNWDKLNKGKRQIREIHERLPKIEENIQKNQDRMLELSAEIQSLDAEINKISTAQRTALQTHILEDCKYIQERIQTGKLDCHEELKQLIILYREYYLCGFNSQGRLYFNDTIAKASEIDNVQVRDLMIHYFPEYDPEEDIRHD